MCYVGKNKFFKFTAFFPVSHTFFFYYARRGCNFAFKNARTSCISAIQAILIALGLHRPCSQKTKRR